VNNLPLLFGQPATTSSVVSPVGWQVSGKLVASAATAKSCIVIGNLIDGGRYGNLFENFSKESSKRGRLREESMYKNNNMDKLPYLPPLPPPRGGVRTLSPGPLAIASSPASAGSRRIIPSGRPTLLEGPSPFGPGPSALFLGIASRTLVQTVRGAAWT
jgi:hypothetical protein